MEICNGLQALVAQSLKGQPAAEMITLNADVWYIALRKTASIAEVDAERVRKGFEKLFPTVTEWPAPKQLLALMPSRPHRATLPEPRQTDEQYAEGLKQIRKISENLGK